VRWRIEYDGNWREYAGGDRSGRGTDDGVRCYDRDAEFHRDGKQRYGGEGCDVGGVVRDGEWMRGVVCDKQRVGRGGDVYGAGSGTEPGDGDVDGNVC
jgi:hypothetical protein